MSGVLTARPVNRPWFLGPEREEDSPTLLLTYEETSGRRFIISSDDDVRRALVYAPQLRATTPGTDLLINAGAWKGSLPSAQDAHDMQNSSSATLH
jgi:hypothetical protein